MVIAFKQLELDLWGDLKSALQKPEVADFEQLWHELEQVIAPLEKNQQLQVAGEAIAQIAQVYLSRARSILDSLEVTDNNEGPVLADDFLSGLMRQSMSIDLSDLMEDLFPAEDSQVNLNSGSQVTPIDKKAASAIARQARKLAKKDLLDLAGKENIELWQSAIANWISSAKSRKFPFGNCSRHSSTPYQLDVQGDFYKTARDIWISN